jgi:hypothetical protein
MQERRKPSTTMTNVRALASLHPTHGSLTNLSQSLVVEAPRVELLDGAFT